jgi:hypothetical protein
MTDQDQPKPKRGRPPKYAGPRQNFNFRITPQTRERVIAAAKESGRSLSEEIEFRVNRDLSWEQSIADIKRLHAEAAAQLSAARVQALRLVGLQILRETEGRPTRVVVDLASLLAEADGIARALRSGFFAGETAPAVEPTRPMTAEEEQRLFAELAELRRTMENAIAKTHAADAAAAKGDDEAA